MSSHAIRVLSPAKLNLCLEIKGLRPDGYHELDMLNVGIELCDAVEVSVGGEDIRIECDDPAVPRDRGNLCRQAAEAFFRAFPETRTGLNIKIEKRIPVAGGLGGGSSNAAAVLFALKALTGTEVGGAELIRLGATVGADVPFFLFRSPAWARGIGEELEDGPALPDYTFLVAPQTFGVSTKWAFSQYDLTKHPDNLKCSRNRGMAPAGWKLFNALEPIVAAAHPEVAKTKDVLLDLGAIGALMTGSGPTVFAVFDGRESAEKARDAAARELGRAVLLCRAVQGPLLREVFHNQE